MTSFANQLLRGKKVTRTEHRKHETNFSFDKFQEYKSFQARELKRHFFQSTEKCFLRFSLPLWQPSFDHRIDEVETFHFILSNLWKQKRIRYKLEHNHVHERRRSKFVFPVNRTNGRVLSKMNDELNVVHFE